MVHNRLSTSTFLDLALQTAALERILSASRTYLTACFALYVWDFILTFPDEYRDMWKADRWTSVRVSFFFNRYWSLLVFVLAMYLFWFEFTPKTCDKIHILKPIAVTILLLNCQFLLGARVWVMWNRRKWVAYFFGILAMAGTTVQVWSFSQNKALQLLPGLRGCISVVRGGQNHQWIYWVPLLFYDTTATIFMLVWLIAQRQNGKLSLLPSVFFRDGVLYFVIVTICNLINVVFFSLPTERNPTLNCPLTLTFTSIMATRIVLHLRYVAKSVDSRGSSRSFPHRCSDTLPKFRSFTIPEPSDTELQSEERRIEEKLRASYPGVMVDVEIETKMEARLGTVEEEVECSEMDYCS
ncbi:hypothetical protein BT69DRAFT_1358049 [Atractiella rhizophila]|nr:hypothetical protein BT69DRAFT_1358049 [Atractiella rhizophila]